MNRYGDAKVLLLFDPYIHEERNHPNGSDAEALFPICRRMFEEKPSKRRPYKIKVGVLSRERPHVIQPYNAAVLVADLSAYAADYAEGGGFLGEIIKEVSEVAPSIPCFFGGLHYRSHRPLGDPILELLGRRSHPADRLFPRRYGPEMGDAIWSAFDSHENGQQCFAVLAKRATDDRFPHTIEERETQLFLPFQFSTPPAPPRGPYNYQVNSPRNSSPPPPTGSTSISA